MERLTVPYEHGDGYRSKCVETCGECDGCWGLDEIVNRLGAYEDTELTPEEVNDAVVGSKLLAKSQLVSAFGVAAERLRELAEADKAGRLVALPCKPGAPVYMTFCGEVWEMRVGQFHVNGYTEPRIWADIDCDWASTQCVRWDLEIGKRIFLTREEAEKALEAVK